MTTSDKRQTLGPFVLPEGQWRRRLHAPWTIIMNDVRTGERRDSKSTNFLDAALKAVLETDPFPMRSTRVWIVDEDGWVVFGYSTDPAYIENQGDMMWVGSEQGFAALEGLGIVDTLELAIWESRARAASDSQEWWKK